MVCCLPRTPVGTPTSFANNTLPLRISLKSWEYCNKIKNSSFNQPFLSSYSQCIWFVYKSFQSLTFSMFQSRSLSCSCCLLLVYMFVFRLLICHVSIDKHLSLFGLYMDVCCSRLHLISGVDWSHWQLILLISDAVRKNNSPLVSVCFFLIKAA